MGSKLQKGLKPLMIKTLAVFMGMCYVLNPLHDQILTVFHSLSHAFEELPHENTSLLEFNFLEHHHHNHNHDHGHHASNVGQDHDHHLITFLNSIFESSHKEHESQKSLTAEIEIDKHFFSSEYRISQSFGKKNKNDFCAIVCKCPVGHSRELYAPPRTFPRS